MSKKVFNVIYFIFYLAAVYDFFMYAGVSHERGEISGIAGVIPAAALVYGGVLIFKQLFRQGGKGSA